MEGGVKIHPPHPLGVNPSQCGWGASQAPRPASTYWSAVSTWFKIMSYPLVTFIFKTFPKHRKTRFWNFLPEIWKIQKSAWILKKKIEKIDFFFFFFQKNIVFLFENIFMCFWGISCWSSSKITNFENFTHL